ncbi:MAG: S1 family peptidase [Muribaculaceae bacterium]|nr:S1 family peptidase [Muribaculaceae bacterium]
MNRIENYLKIFIASLLTAIFLTACSDDVLSEMTQTNQDIVAETINGDQAVANALNDKILSSIALTSKSLSGEPIYPSYYGGSFIEPNGHLTLFVVGDSLSAVAKFEKISDNPLIQYRVANYSYQELCEVNDAILTHLENGPKSIAKNVSAYGLNTEYNAVEVYLVDASVERILEFKTVYNHPCLTFSQLGKFTNEATNIYPGDKVCKTISTENKYGSIAFRAQETSGNKRIGFVTAGHVLSLNESAYINSVKMGECVKSVVDGGAKADAAFVVIDSNQTANFKLLNYVNGVTTAPLSVTTSQPGIGTYVNKWGTETGKTGGYIKNTSVNIVDEAGKTIMQDLVIADYKSAGGDSGGLVYTIVASSASSSTTRYTVGVHKGRSEDDKLAIYSKADNVLSVLGLKRY